MEQNLKIRKENLAGQYTTIQLSILRDKNLSSNSKLLLFEIFSDSDTFDLSRTVYCNRLGWQKTTFTNSVTELCQAGYIKRTVNNPNKGTYFYTVSEFGNLTKEEAKPKKNKKPTSTPTQKIIEPKQETTPPVEQESKPFNLQDYSDLIFNEYDKAIQSGLNIEQNTYIDYLNNASTKGKLTKEEQITSSNLQAILKTLVIKPEIKKEVEKVVDVPSIDYSVVTPVEELNKVIAKQRGRLTVPKIYKLEEGINNGEITNLDTLLDLIYPNRHNQIVEKFITKADMESMIDAKKTKAQSIDDMKAIKIQMNNWFEKNKNVTEAQASQEILLRKNALRPPVTGGNQD